VRFSSKGRRRTTIPRRWSLGLALLALLLGAVAVQAQGSSEPDAPSQASADCVIPSDEALHAKETAPPEEPLPSDAWLANDAAQGAVQTIDQALTARFGDDDLDAGRDPLQAGLIGVASDDHARELVVVVDPEMVDQDALQGELRSRVSDSTLRVRVGPSCHSAADLLAAEAALDARTWHARAAAVSYGAFLDARTSTFNVTFSAEDQPVADALKATLGEAVTIEFGTPTRRGRLDDGEPHWGGAGIGRPRNNNFCTSGFTVQLPNHGTQGSVTAGHCFANGQRIWSGPEFYGHTHGERGFPRFDMIRIHPHGETFAPRIHTDPGSPTVRTVVASGNPRRGSFVCVSGMVTRAKCGLEVTSTRARLCDPSGCTPNLFRAAKPGETVGRGGDSGAPVYNRFSNATAAIRGMEIGGTRPTNIYAHKVSTITRHLNVAVAGGAQPTRAE
jgi:hypothetical protein